MLVTVIAEQSYPAVRQKIEQVQRDTDAVELRLDFWQDWQLEELARLQQDFAIPFIMTLRKESQGGKFLGTEKQRLALLADIAALKPAFIDLEYDVPLDFGQKLKAEYPAIQLIRSYHDFDKMPHDLDTVLHSMQDQAFSIYKIVGMAESTLDCLRTLSFVKDRSKNMQVACFCMGELGSPSRILGPIVGNALQYACVDEDKPVVASQLSLSTLKELYRVKTFNAHTEIYALIGNPVDKSAGHWIHNHAFAFLKKNAVYVKLALKAEELASFFSLCRDLPFKGFSITMPLKEVVIPHLDELDPEAKQMGSVNTIVVVEGRFIGHNTDAAGALDALEKKVPVAGKTMVILGAGGTGRAIGFEAKKRQAKLVIVNRSQEKGEMLARALNAKAYALNELKNGSLSYDILVNTTPAGMADQGADLQLPADFLHKDSLVMDTVYNPVHTPLLQKAAALSCTLTYGYEMFLHQAVLQLQLWFGPLLHRDSLYQECLATFSKKVLNS